MKKVITFFFFLFIFICALLPTNAAVDCDHIYEPFQSDNNQHWNNCLICGYTKKESHSFSNEWIKSSTSHWHECTICMLRIDYSFHIPDDDKQQCKVCSNSLNPYNYHSHDIDTSIRSDSKSHWYGCNGCNRKFLETEHSYDSQCGESCTVCGQVRKTKHQYETSTFAANERGHWRICALCGSAGKTNAHTPGEPATESTPQTCTSCGYIIQEASNHTHEVSENLLSDLSAHWQICTICNAKLNISEHNYDNWCDSYCKICNYDNQTCHQTHLDLMRTDQNGHCWTCKSCQNPAVFPHVPGAAATAESPQVCSVCEAEIAPQLNHSHSYNDEYIITDEGHRQACSCGFISYTDAHKYDEGIVIVEATEDQKGIKLYTCTLCKYSKETEYSAEIEETTAPVETAESETSAEDSENIEPVSPKNYITFIILVIFAVIGVTIVIISLCLTKNKNN